MGPEINHLNPYGELEDGEIVGVVRADTVIPGTFIKNGHLTGVEYRPGGVYHSVIHLSSRRPFQLSFDRGRETPLFFPKTVSPSADIDLPKKKDTGGFLSILTRFSPPKR